jgi:hypothetical protein
VQLCHRAGLYRDEAISLYGQYDFRDDRIRYRNGRLRTGLLEYLRMLGVHTDFIYVMEKEAVLLIYHIVVTLAVYQIVSRSVIRHRGDRYMYRGTCRRQGA